MANAAAHVAQQRTNVDYTVSPRDWIIVLAACLGAFMAILDIQITNSSLANIQGSLGATIDEGSWISTAYLIAEIIVIPMTDWLSRTFGLKRYLLTNAALFIFFSCLCGSAKDLPSMIVYRAAQGFTGGILIPIAMQLILRKLPTSKQPIGLALFGLSATFAPAIGPSLGGWITDNFGWPYIFYLNILPGVLLISALGLTMEKTRANFDLLKTGDYFGIFFMAVGLGCLETFMEEGNRKDWFGSPFITIVAIVAVVSLTIGLTIELTTKNPFMDLKLYARRNFFFAGIANLAVGAGLYGPTYILSVYFSQMHNYNPLQIGQVMMWSGIPQLFITPFVPLLLKKVDARILIFTGLGLFIVGFAQMINLNPDYAGPQVIGAQVVRAIGLPLIFVPLSGLATSGIERFKLGSASALFNMTRNLGGSFGIAGISTLLTIREKFHSQFIGESVSVFSSATQERIDMLTNTFIGAGFDPVIANQRVMSSIDLAIRKQANFMAFGDCFFIFSVILSAGCIAVLFLKKDTLSHSHETH